MTDRTVTQNESEGRYEITVGRELAGFVTYTERGDLVALNHTETLPAFAGQGVATALIEQTLDDIARRGLRVLPFCPFVNRYIADHPERLSQVPSDMRVRFGLPEESKQKLYEGAELSVSFDAAICTHSAKCVNGLPAVFDTTRRPWITPDAADADAVREQVERCPSGALKHHPGRDG